MKRVLLTLIALLCIISASAQKLTIESFSLDANDITASSQQRLDGNGDPCALVKVQLAVQGATFSGNTVGNVGYDNGEYLVYMTEGSKNLQVKHFSYLPVDVNFADYGINSLKGKKTYVLTLILPQANNVNQIQTLAIKINPKDAIILIDGDVVETTNGQATIPLPVGDHRFNATKTGYIKQQGEITLTADAPGKLIIELDKNNAVAAKPANNIATQTQQTTQVQTPVQPVSQNSSSISGTAQTFTVNGVSFNMIPVEGGTFTMGATKELGTTPYDFELPTHSVTLSSYMIGETEVTQKLWKAVMGKNPSFSKDNNKPVESITWDDCQVFIQKLNTLTGQNFRLPTEAEWEFACRGGNKSKGYKYSGSNEIDKVAWHKLNCGNSSHPVKKKLPNELGIYDMSGNVWEWCQDFYGNYTDAPQTNPINSPISEHRMFRGGGWGDTPRACSPSFRGHYFPNAGGDAFLGMRLALPLSASNKFITIHGEVVLENEPLFGAMVLVSDSNPAYGTVSGLDGKFTLDVLEGAELFISYVGYETVKVKAQDNMRVIMHE